MTTQRTTRHSQMKTAMNTGRCGISARTGTHKPIVSTSDELEEDHSQNLSSVGSLCARASSMSSGSPDRVVNMSRLATRESVDGILVSEKLLREMRSRNGHWALPTSLERTGTFATHAEAAIEESLSPNDEARYRRLQLRETDGGIRLAGGWAGELTREDLDRGSMSDGGSTLPPSYSSYFGDS